MKLFVIFYYNNRTYDRRLNFSLICASFGVKKCSTSEIESVQSGKFGQNTWDFRNCLGTWLWFLNSEWLFHNGKHNNTSNLLHQLFLFLEYKRMLWQNFFSQKIEFPSKWNNKLDFLLVINDFYDFWNFQYHNSCWNLLHET